MKKIILFAAVLLSAIAGHSQLTVNIAPDKDNSIYSESGNSNGAGALYAGATCTPNSRRALLHFDIAGNLPAGATITSVTLTLNVSGFGPDASSETYSLHPLTANWGEGTSFGTGTGAPAIFPDATWSDAILGTPWTTAGGDYTAAVSSANLTASLGNFNWSSAAMAMNVQNWLDAPATNFGWILIGDELNDCTAREFGSKEVGTEPVLSVTYTCANPPTAICQNVSASLDASGNYVLDPADLDGGSVAVCGGTLSFGASQTAFDCMDVVPVPGNLVLTAVYDGPLTGGLPKGIELYVLNNIADLSNYGIGSATNGGGSDGQEFTFPPVSVAAGTFIYVASEAIEFQNYFGFAPDYTTSHVNINGDDAIEVFGNSVVIDVFGDIMLDGSGEPWDYLDGWAYRNNLTGPDGSTWALGNWTMSGINALDGATSNSTATTPIPIKSYLTAAAIPVTLTVTDQFSNVSTCNAAVTVFDHTGPTASNPVAIDVECIADVPASDILAVTDEADNCTAVPVIAFVSDVSDGNTCPEVIIRTYSVTDAYDNQTLVTQTITVNDNMNPTASNPAAVNVACIADVPAVDILAVTDEADNCSVPTVAFVSDVSDGNTCPETITRTYSVTDLCGNSINVTQTIIVDDTTNPTASNPAPITVPCIADVPAPNPAVLTDETDNCGPPVVAFVSDVSDGNTCPEVITRTYSVADACGNQIIVTQTIIVDDTTNPMASNPADIIAPGGLLPAPDVTVVTDEADNCGVPVVAFVSDVSDGNTCPETITRTYSVTDNCGNQILVAHNILITADVSVTVTGFMLTANATGSTFQWVSCPTYAFIPGQTSAEFNPDADGDYAVIVTTGSCSDTSVCNTILGLSASENQAADLVIYPNPANTTVTVMSTAFERSFVITISDARGRIVRQEEIIEASQSINVSELEHGVYFITSTKDNNSLVMKLIISG